MGFRALSIPFSKSQDVVVKEDLVIFLPPPATYRAARSNGTPIPSRALAVPKAIQIEKRGPEAADEAGMARMMMTFFFRRHRPKSVEFFFFSLRSTNAHPRAARRGSRRAVHRPPSAAEISTENATANFKKERKREQNTHRVGGGRGGRRRAGAAGSRRGGSSDQRALLLGEGAGDQSDHEDKQGNELHFDEMRRKGGEGEAGGVGTAG